MATIKCREGLIVETDVFIIGCDSGVTAAVATASAGARGTLAIKGVPEKEG